MLTLADLRLALDDMLGKRRALLVSTSSGKLYEPMFKAARDAILALPPVFFGATPLAEELTKIDGVHDGFGGAMHLVCEAYLCVPDLPDELRAAIGRIENAFVPNLRQLKDDYASEASAAKQRVPALEALKADLMLIPVHGGRTLYDWAKSFVGAGLTIDRLLAEGTEGEVSPNARKGAARIRSGTLGQINRFRAALADEVRHDPKLARDLDAKLFVYIDQLEAERTASGAVEIEPPPPTNA